jgi:hypothetical protein
MFSDHSLQIFVYTPPNTTKINKDNNYPFIEFRNVEEQKEFLSKLKYTDYDVMHKVQFVVNNNPMPIPLGKVYNLDDNMDLFKQYVVSIHNNTSSDYGFLDFMKENGWTK